MASYASIIETAIQQYEPNQVIGSNELYRALVQKVPEQTFYKTLERLSKNGELVHLTKGIYYRPKRNRFGTIPISEYEISAHYLKAGQGVMVLLHPHLAA